jgi:drug/metabolite transporter (DMT)-like permease
VLKKQGAGSLLLLLAAVIWGSSFVAQIMGMDYIQPFTFQALRSLLGALALLPLILFSDGRRKKKGAEKRPEEAKDLLIGGTLCGLVLFAAINLQQFGLVYTTAGKAGFLTALYIVIVPLYGLFLRHRVRPRIWVAVVVATLGLYLLSVTETFTINSGDLLLILCAFAFAAQILVVDRFSLKVSGMKLCAFQFLVCGLLSLIAMFIFETPTLSGIRASIGPLLYAGVLSSGVAYTLQIIGQRTTPPAVASLLMSLESVFAVLAGMLVLGEMLTIREGIGSALMFFAIILASFSAAPQPAGDV